MDFKNGNNIDKVFVDGGGWQSDSYVFNLRELEALFLNGTEIAHPRCQDTQIFWHADLPSIIKALETRRHIHERGE